jgi:hypothetical protein
MTTELGEFHSQRPSCAKPWLEGYVKGELGLLLFFWSRLDSIADAC